MTNTIDYKDTLQLPHTDFPMRGNLPETEKNWLEYWNNIDLWNRTRTQSNDQEPFILHDGPPYANGHLHIGHALNKILKDIISRSRQMLGYNSHYVPGWDCHGLPIEWKIEEKYRAKGLNKDDVPVNQFRQECREFAKEWIDVQRDEFKRLGIMADWDNPYTTMHYRAEAIIADQLHKFLMNGSLFRGSKPVLWSIVEKTALAEAEVEYKEYKSASVYVAFPIKKCASSDLQRAHIVIWTTTPWTLPGNRAIAYADDINYCLIKVTDKGDSTLNDGMELLVARNLLDTITSYTKNIKFSVIRDVNASELQGVIAHHPLWQKDNGYGFDVPCLLADYVTDSQGSGFVHVNPAHGLEDYTLCKEQQEYTIDIPDLVMEDGAIYPHIPLFAGAYVLDEQGKDGNINGLVIKALIEEKMLVAKHSVRHSYPHSWRSKAPLIYRNTSQWFISMDTNNLRDKALKAVDDTNFYPKSGHKRLYDMIANRPDWCVSRQRTWGVPLPIFMHKYTNELLKDEQVNARIFEAFELEGADAWFSSPPSRFLGDTYNADDYIQIKDVLDVWFDSGSTHAFVLEDRPALQWPANLYLEGSDQHRGWFHSSLLVSTGTNGRAPYDEVLTHGFILDEKGRKMSKSLGNVVTPEQVTKQMGADILRLWVVASDYTEDLGIGPNALKQHAESYRRIRNSLRWLLGVMNKDDALLDIQDITALPLIEQYMLHRLYGLNKDIQENLYSYNFHRIFNMIHNFCTNDLSSFYFDIRKDCLYCDGLDNPKRQACISIVHEIFNHLVRFIAPILCFTAEEAWQKNPCNTSENSSIHLELFPTINDAWHNKQLDDTMAVIHAWRKTSLAAIEELRSQKIIGSSLQASLTLYANDEEATLLHNVNFAEITITSSVTINSHESNPANLHNVFHLGDGRYVSVKEAEGHKCERCWQVTHDININNICGRCADVVG